MQASEDLCASIACSWWLVGYPITDFTTYCQSYGSMTLLDQSSALIEGRVWTSVTCRLAEICSAHVAWDRATSFSAAWLATVDIWCLCYRQAPLGLGTQALLDFSLGGWLVEEHGIRPRGKRGPRKLMDITGSPPLRSLVMHPNEEKVRQKY